MGRLKSQVTLMLFPQPRKNFGKISNFIYAFVYIFIYLLYYLDLFFLPKMETTRNKRETN